jgi:hypothetical protein
MEQMRYGLNALVATFFCLFVCVQLKKLMSSCAGANPELTAGVLLPPLLAVASELAVHKRERIVDEHAELVHLIYSHSPQPAIRLKPTDLLPPQSWFRCRRSTLVSLPLIRYRRWLVWIQIHWR